MNGFEKPRWYLYGETDAGQSWLDKEREVVRCRDCKHLDDSQRKDWDSYLAAAYGEPPLFCDLLSVNEWRMDGNRRVAERRFLEVDLNGFCAWGERRQP